MATFAPDQSQAIKEIETYSDAVRRNQIACTEPFCDYCGELSENFKRHDVRPRKFRIIVDLLVVVVVCWVMRFKCPGCGITFTQQPLFALAHKRYAAPTLEHYCEAYLSDPAMTYRGLFRPDAVGYEETEQQLSHASVHRWVSTFGKMAGVLSRSQDLILQKNPDSTVCRDAAGLTIPARKYRSPARKTILERGLRLFFVNAIYLLTFGRPIFPSFATRTGFT
jgi:transposase-like protein